MLMMDGSNSKMRGMLESLYSKIPQGSMLDNRAFWFLFLQLDDGQEKLDTLVRSALLPRLNSRR